MSEQQDIAQTIYAQLGGYRLGIMTGAKEFVKTPNSLIFKLPSNMTKGRITHFEVKLDEGRDLYVLTSRKWNSRRMFMKDIETVSDVSVADLRRTFTQMTGLETSL